MLTKEDRHGEGSETQQQGSPQAEEGREEDDRREGIDQGRYAALMAAPFVRHRQPWKSDELAKLRTLAKKGMGLKAIAKALTRSEESVQDRAREEGIRIAKLR